jgi:hypothetical protein
MREVCELRHSVRSRTQNFIKLRAMHIARNIFVLFLHLNRDS